MFSRFPSADRVRLALDVILPNALCTQAMLVGVVSVQAMESDGIVG
jgi:hypothetical protein